MPFDPKSLVAESDALQPATLKNQEGDTLTEIRCATCRGDLSLLFLMGKQVGMEAGEVIFCGECGAAHEIEDKEPWLTFLSLDSPTLSPAQQESLKEVQADVLKEKKRREEAPKS